MTAFLVEPIDGAPAGGRLAVPGDKSIGHRSLLFGALCDGEVEVTGLSGGQDNARTRGAVEAMGARVDDLGPGRVRVHGVGVDGLCAPAGPIDCGNSGTSIRLLCGLLAGQSFTARLGGDASLSGRPMRRVAEPLARMGARVEGESRAGRPGEIYPPLTVHGARGAIRGIDEALAVASAQVKSAILLAGLYADGPVRVSEPGPSRDHSERMLAHLGAPVRVLPDGAVLLDVRGWDRRLRAAPLAVPGDPSSAAFLVAAALVTGAERVHIAGVCVNPTRTGFLDVLADLGAVVDRLDARELGGEPVADLVVSAATSGWSALRGAAVAGATTVRSIDELPILSVVAARADGTTEIRDAAELRVKESDRIATTCAMLRAFGVSVEERRDGFSVRGRPGERLRAARIDSAGDHRIAMAAAVAALTADGPSRIEDVDNVATSYPGFADALNRVAGRTVCTAQG
jgi:3-phosphoshikimate 1-carboxyvinyltransferase